MPVASINTNLPVVVLRWQRYLANLLRLRPLCSGVSFHQFVITILLHLFPLPVEMIEKRSQVYRLDHATLGAVCLPRWRHAVDNAAIPVNISAGFVTVLWILPEAVLEG